MFSWFTTYNFLRRISYIIFSVNRVFKNSNIKWLAKTPIFYMEINKKIIESMLNIFPDFFILQHQA